MYTGWCHWSCLLCVGGPVPYLLQARQLPVPVVVGQLGHDLLDNVVPVVVVEVTRAVLDKQRPLFPVLPVLQLLLQVDRLRPAPDQVALQCLAQLKQLPGSWKKAMRPSQGVTQGIFLYTYAVSTALQKAGKLSFQVNSLSF